MKNSAIKPLTLSYTHDSTNYIIRGMFGTEQAFNLIVFDAHLDLGVVDESNFIHPGNWVQDILNVFSNVEIYYFGVCDKEPLKGHGIDKIYFNQFPCSNKPTYVTFDLDVLSYSIMPSVRYPQVSGMTYNELVELINLIDFKKVVGVDVTEFLYERASEKENLLLSRLMYELMLKLGSEKK